VPAFSRSQQIQACEDMIVEVREDAKLAQKLGQLQPFIAAFPQECTGRLVSFGPT
jgi:hypothetical protein